MNIPPAPNSPKNILNILIDDCIGEIFRRIATFEDFLNATEVCKRFRKCAMDASYKFKSIDIEKQMSPINVPACLVPTLFQFGRIDRLEDWRRN